MIVAGEVALGTGTHHGGQIGAFRMSVTLANVTEFEDGGATKLPPNLPP